jgi:hypothetical protein
VVNLKRREVVNLGGISILQQIGNIDFSIEGLLKGRKKNIGATRKLHDFIRKKKAFITNQSDSETSYEKLKAEENRVFRDFITELIFENHQEIKQLVKGDGQISIFTDEKKGSLFDEQIALLESENEKLAKVLLNIKETGRLPFSFDIDFMEVFLTKEDSGFDLVIGNPPYVRQEDILPAEDALELERLLKPENKVEKALISKAYKEMLSSKVFQTWPFLATKARTQIDGSIKTIDIYGKKVPGRSDLYVYFQLICPSLLNSKGTFCFIISNSWLDVEFGGFVQQFLLKHTRLHAIYDCNVRSFTASVNTIIYLHSAPINTNLTENQYKTFIPDGLEVRFIMNKTNYTEISYATLLIEQEHCRENTFRRNFRVIVKNSKELWDEGYDPEKHQYQSNKWGGKYLRAPELFYKIVDSGKLIPLNNCAEVFSVSWSRLGFNSEIILKKTLDLTNSEFVPVFKSPKDITKIKVSNDDTSNVLQISDLISNKIVFADLLWVDLRNDKHTCHYCSEPIAFTHNFHGINVKSVDSLHLCTFLNSSLCCFFIEILGRGNLGEGAIRILANDLGRNLPVLKNIAIGEDSVFWNRKQNDIFTEFGFTRFKPFRLQQPSPLPDRKELDDLIFDELGLTLEERNEVYWATAELVKQRLDKAGSR